MKEGRLAVFHHPQSPQKQVGSTLFSGSRKRLQGVWRIGIVRIQKGDVVALRRRKAVVARGGDAGVFLAKATHARIFFHVGVQGLLRVVGGTVVDDHNLKITHRLRKQAVKRLWQKRRTVIGRNDYGKAQGEQPPFVAVHRKR